MNCRCFQDKLFEYVDGTLSAGELAAAQQHLAGCSPCRKLVQKEQHVAETLSTRLRRGGENLTLRPEIARNVLAAPRTASPAATESLAGLWLRRLRLATIPVSLLVVAAFVLAVDFARKPIQERAPAPVATHEPPTIADRQEPAASLEMSYRLPVHEFHQEGNLVVDAFMDRNVVADGTIPADSLKNLPQKLEIKTPL
jgi:anti-sigma-K factor RskA